MYIIYKPNIYVVIYSRFTQNFFNVLKKYILLYMYIYALYVVVDFDIILSMWRHYFKKNSRKKYI